MSTAQAELSLEAQLASLDEATRNQLLADIIEEVGTDTLMYCWEYFGRPGQLEATNSEAHKTLVLAGRGYGKTRVGSEWVRKQVEGTRPTRGFLAARTAADVRDTLIQGESGILNTFPPSQMPKWIASQRTVYFANGSTALCLSAKEPDQARGPQAEWALCDEWATWDFSNVEGELDLWDNIQIATRLGAHPQIMLTTTPKRVKKLREMVKAALTDPSIKLVRGSTFENIALSEQYLDTMMGLYGGTRLASQELYAQVLDEIEGALWSEKLIESLERQSPPVRPPLRVVAVDPSVAEQPKDECGIVVVGATREAQPAQRRGWVLADRSGLMAPAKWAKVAVDTAREFECGIVAEANQGGAMVKEMIHNIDAKISVKLIHAKVSKKLRAEPVSAVYEQGRVGHVGRFVEMEEQMTSWVPGETADSPDRVDALVHGVTALMLPSGRGVAAGKSRISSPGRGLVIPTGAGSAIGRR